MVRPASTSISMHLSFFFDTEAATEFEIEGVGYTLIFILDHHENHRGVGI